MPVFLLLLTLAPLLSCDAPGPLAADRDPGELFGPAEEELIVVDAILIVGAPLPPVMLRRTEAPGVSYEAAAAGLTGAEVLIRSGDALFEYRADPAMAGRYLPPDSAPRVEPDRVYELQVASGDAPVVRARTLTPARARIEELVWLDDDLETELQQLRLFSEIGDGVYDAGENQLEYPVGVLIARLGVGGKPGSTSSPHSTSRAPVRICSTPIGSRRETWRKRRTSSWSATTPPPCFVPKEASSTSPGTASITPGATRSGSTPSTGTGSTSCAPTTSIRSAAPGRRASPFSGPSSTSTTGSAFSLRPRWIPSASSSVPRGARPAPGASAGVARRLRRASDRALSLRTAWVGVRAQAAVRKIRRARLRPETPGTPPRGS